LIQILSPQQKVPDIELLSGFFEVRQYDQEFGFYLHLDLYFDVKIDHPIQIPFHRCNVKVSLGKGKSIINLRNIKMTPPYTHLGGAGGFKSTSVTIESTPDEILMNGSGHVIFKGDNRGQAKISEKQENIHVYLELLPGGFMNPIFLKYTFSKGEPREKSIYTFHF